MNTTAQVVFDLAKLVGTVVVAIAGGLYVFVFLLKEGATAFFDARYEELVQEDQELTEEMARSTQLSNIVFTHKAVWACKAFRGITINAASNIGLRHDAEHTALVVRGRQGDTYCYFVAQFGGNGYSTGKSKLDLRLVFSSIKNAALAICKNSTMSRVWVKNMTTNPPSNGRVILEGADAGECSLGTWISLGREYSMEELYDIASSVDRVKSDYNVISNNCRHYVEDLSPLVR